MDYYGSIIKDNQEITNELVNHFKESDRDYIEKIIEGLRYNGVLSMKNSISGWMVFIRPQMITEIQTKIYDDTRLLSRQKAVSFVFAVCHSDSTAPTNSLDVGYDIIREITNYIIVG